MTTSVTSATSSSTYQAYVPTVGQTTSTAALTSQAVSLSTQSAVVAALGGSSSATVYTPSGLLNTLQQAGVASDTIATPESGSDTSSTAQDTQDQAIVSSLSSSTSSSGIYTGTGTVSGLTEQASANWADLLKANPSLASTVISSSYNLGLVSSLSTTA
ncbi:hypothetical protein GJ699_28620 [Duganella sp. FT80W]|uniref:Uncharacterized protein n=1 Tax=Duganella guangzhouensis TaxID=2666084 RepID=A0A6I2L872_9BURK|nr:hypothetical protein [Duganella guangzhouensis]MRW93960.1 hypothetical protein [Duganella guangzhouensis]